MEKIRTQRGQLLLVVVLTMIVALTVGLSVASRTISNLKISKQSEESQRSFQAAEAGIEQILQLGGVSLGSGAILSNNSEFKTVVSHTSGKSFLLNGGEIVDQDTGLDVWLSTYPDFTDQIASANVTIYWGTTNQIDCTNKPGGVTGPSKVKSALEVIVLSGAKLNPTMNKYFFEANGGCSRGVDNVGTTGAGGDVSNITFQNSVRIPPAGNFTNGLIMRVIPIFNSTKIAITSSAPLPKQGTTIVSTGKSSDTVRKVEYFSTYPQIPVEIFPYSLITQ